MLHNVVQVKTCFILNLVHQLVRDYLLKSFRILWMNDWFKLYWRKTFVRRQNVWYPLPGVLTSPERDQQSPQSPQRKPWLRTPRTVRWLSSYTFNSYPQLHLHTHSRYYWDHGVATTALLCHKDTAEGNQSPHKGHFLPFAVSLWHKGGFHTRKGSIIDYRRQQCNDAMQPYIYIMDSFSSCPPSIVALCESRASSRT